MQLYKIHVIKNGQERATITEYSLAMKLRGKVKKESFDGQHRHYIPKKQSNSLRKHVYSNTLKISPLKTESFQIKILIFFTYFCSKHRLRALVRTVSALFFSRNEKNNVYPCKSQFYYIKVGLKRSKLYRYAFVMYLLVPQRDYHNT